MSEYFDLNDKSNWQIDNLSKIILILGFPLCDWSINALSAYIEDVKTAEITSCLQSRAIAELRNAKLKHNNN